MRQISIVIVLKDFTHNNKHSNVDRFIRIGMRTYERFLDKEGIAEFIVVVSNAELEQTKKRICSAYPNWPWRFVIESAIVSNNAPSGWAKQQTAKLAIASVVKTAHYLIIDDDTYLTRPLKADDLFDDRGRALMNKCPIDFPFFFLWSAEVIDVDYEEIQDAPFHMAITPEIFVTDIVKEIVAYLEKRYGTHMKWQEYLAEHKYTEYCLYWSYLIKKRDDSREKYYVCDADSMELYGHATSGPEHDMVTNVERSFRDNAKFHFSFVQSSLDKYTVDQVEEQIMKYL